jgi:hopanoid biosynthesis associated protein HpnK
VRQAGAEHQKKRGLIVTADDFGLDLAVNEAVERAHCHGVLQAASLMVAAPAAADAVARARRLPRLRVGLHLVLADGPACLPRERIPDLVGADGRFDARMARAGFRFFFLPRVRRQLHAEIRAQFEAYAATGLALDHVNAHKHFHLHPTVLGLILDIGREFGLRAVRLPAEPGLGAGLRPWLALMRRRLERAGVVHNDFVFGMAASGRMNEAALLQTLARLPPGVCEIYCHPATRDGLTQSMRAYRHQEELAGLCSPRVRDRLAALDFPTGGYADLFGEGARR